MNMTVKDMMFYVFLDEEIRKVLSAANAPDDQKIGEIISKADFDEIWKRATKRLAASLN